MTKLFNRHGCTSLQLLLCVGFLLYVILPVQAAPFAYVTNLGANNVSVVNIATNTVDATVGVGGSPIGVAISPDGTRAYIGNQAAGSVSVIDTTTQTVIATVPLGSNVYGIAINPSGTRLYAAMQFNNTVSVIDTATYAVSAPIAVGNQPSGIAVHPAGTSAYVVNLTSNTVSVINTSNNTVSATVNVGNNPFGIAVLPNGSRVYVANRNDNSVSVIDTSNNTVVNTIAVGFVPIGLAVNPGGTRLYVSNSGSNSVTVIDTALNTVLGGAIAVGNSPRGISISPDASRLYVVNGFANNMSVIDTATNTVVATVPVGNNPIAFGQFIVAADATPNAFSLTAQTGVARSTPITSNTITVAGINVAVPISIAGGGTYSVNGAAYTAVAGNVNSGDTVSVKQTSSASFGTLTGATLTIGGVSSTFNVTTAAASTSYTGPSATGTGSITASFSGGAGCGFTTAAFIPVSGGAGSPPAGSAPAGIIFPHGLFDFVLSACQPGTTVTLTLTYPQALAANTAYWKYGPSPGNAAPHWYQMPATIVGNTATFSITDGGLGDDDLTANGAIVDQGGPGAATVEIPTLSEWARMVLAAMLGVLGIGVLRRRALKAVS